MTTSEIAKQCGVSADTVRHYERVGVIPAAARGPNGYRSYPRETVERVRLVRRALAIGFTLDEIGRIFRDREAGSPPCRQVRAMAGEKLADLERRIEEMRTMRDELVQVIEEWDVRLAATRDGEPARLLEQLKGNDDATDHPRTDIRSGSGLPDARAARRRTRRSRHGFRS
jgi:DNA-binding transcriptional MerR regulator